MAGNTSARVVAAIRRRKRLLVSWFDYAIIYRLFLWRFNRRLAENPAQLQFFVQYMQNWQRDREVGMIDRRNSPQAHTSENSSLEAKNESED